MGSRAKTRGTTYGHIITRKWDAARPRVSLRAVASRIGYSHEYVRRAILGGAVGSREFSDALSKYFGLDADQMWALALREKLEDKTQQLLAQLDSTPRLRRWLIPARIVEYREVAVAASTKEEALKRFRAQHWDEGPAADRYEIYKVGRIRLEQE